MKEITNHGKSIRNKLLNVMRSSQKQYMYLLARYFNERLLYRISKSRYRDNFILKGGSLLYVLDGLNARPTVDIDLLGHNISRDTNKLKEALIEIFEIECAEDGVIFDTKSIEPSPIAIDKKYPGVRFEFQAKMDTIVYKMNIDIGFGDVMTPSARMLEFPILLSGLPKVNVSAYPLESMIAEKFHAMIDRDVVNSRMKDFFDCYILLTTTDIDDKVLFEAICKTFDNRKLEANPDLQLFTETFHGDESRNHQWKSFLKKIKYDKDLSFAEVMSLIKTRLEPMYRQYISIT